MSLRDQIKKVRQHWGSFSSTTQLNAGSSQDIASSSFNFESRTIPDPILELDRPAGEGKTGQEFYSARDDKDIWSATDFSLLNNWIVNCQTQHGQNCGKLDNVDFQYGFWGDIMLVDVEQECVTPMIITTLFIALSYVSGGAKRFQLTRKNLKRLSVPGSLKSFMHEFPNVIQDTIRLVSKMGYGYLWIDQLCIPQDDAESKKRQIANIGAIYSSALLTIVAVNTISVDDEFLGMHMHISLKTYDAIQNMYNRPTDQDAVIRVIDRSVYNSRGWTFVERYLSRRRLYLLKDQMYFECGKGIWCKDLNSVPTLSNHCLMTISSPDERWTVGPQISGWVESVKNQDWDAAFRFYARLVKAYSSRNFTDSGDISQAFRGVIEILEISTDQLFLQCLPGRLFDWALLWIPFDKVTRRPSPESGKSLFPSWSWVGWIGRVCFDFASSFGLVSLRICPGMKKMKLVRIQKKGKQVAYVGNSHHIGTRMTEKALVLWKDPELTAPREVLISESVTVPAFDFGDPMSGEYVLGFTADAIEVEQFDAVPASAFTTRDPYPPDTSRSHSKAKPKALVLRYFGADAGMLFGITLDSDIWQNRRQYKLIAISERPSLSKPMYAVDAHGSLRYDDLEFPVDPVASEAKEARWAYYNVLLVKPVGQVYERVAVGLVETKMWVQHHPKTMDLLLG